MAGVIYWDFLVIFREEGVKNQRIRYIIKPALSVIATGSGFFGGEVYSGWIFSHISTQTVSLR